MNLVTEITSSPAAMAGPARASESRVGPVLGRSGSLGAEAAAQRSPPSSGACAVGSRSRLAAPRCCAGAAGGAGGDLGDFTHTPPPRCW